jgi:hypothetical protein
VSGEKSGRGREKNLTGGSRLSEGERERRSVPFRDFLVGPQAPFSVGPKGSPGFFSYFLFFSSFSFSVFLISSYPFQI